MSNSNESAFPFVETKECESISCGLSKLEYISAMALHGLLSNPNYNAKERPDMYASDAVKFAVALFNELENI